MDSSIFDTAVAIVLKHEGGYVNDPNDAGGETNFGISKRSYPNIDIKSLTVEKAKAIYLTDWWLKLHINKLPDFIAPKVLDTTVLAGSWGIRILQRVLAQKDDGVIGPKTIASAAGICGRADLRETLLAAYCQTLQYHFDEIVAAHPDQARFQRGWDARALAVN